MPSSRPLLVALCAVALSSTLVACGTSGASQPSAPPEMAEVVVAERGRTEVFEARERAEPDAADRQLVRTATVDLEAESDDAVPAVVEGARSLVVSLGGYVASEAPRAMTLRVPDARLDEALDGLGTLADVARREVRAQDVTAAYTDLQVQLDNARALQVRLRALLAEAATVADVLAVERELARVTTDVDRLEGRMRLLQNQVAFSTVFLTVRDDVDPGPVGWVFVGLYEAVKWLLVWE